MRTPVIYRFALTLYNTFRLNAFYILLALLVPLILWKVQVGRDIIVSLSEGHEQHYINIPLLIASFSMLAVSTWVIPVLGIDLWKFIVKRPDASSQQLYRGLIALYNGEDIDGNGHASKSYTHNKQQFPIRYFANLPWMIFLYVTVRSFFPAQPLVAVAAIVILCLAIIFIDGCYRKKRVPQPFQLLWDNATDRGNSDRTKALRYVASMGVIFILFLAVIGLLASWQRFNPMGLKTILIGANFLAILFVYAYMKFSENVDVRHAGTSFFVSKYIHILSLSVAIMLAIFLQFSNSQRWPVEIGFFSPIFILIIVISLYLFLADVLITTQLKITHLYNDNPSAYHHSDGKPGKQVWVWYRPLIRLLALGFIFLFFFNSINSHRIRKDVAQHGRAYTADLRPKLIDYFDQWVQYRLPAPNDTLTIYLVSGQGGGSRAAAWFFMAMNYLDSLESTPTHRFADHVFSISTVSGSTSGAAMYLADRYLGVSPATHTIAPRMKTIYARNYLSSSFWGALIGDGVEGIKHEVIDWALGTKKPFPRDRNYYFQQEEVYGYLQATRAVQEKRASGFFNNDYLAPYIISPSGGLTSGSNGFNKDLPLFFINSAIVERGERGVFSPVDLKSFSLGTDLYQSFKAHHSDYNIPFITCVNQSQAFPIINAYNYLDGEGRLIDGGIYENSGTTTTLEIYEALRRHLMEKGETGYTVRIVCINIVNTDMESERSETRFRPASILNTATAAFRSPFGGHESFSYKNIERKANTPPDRVYPAILKREVPLTRMLQPAAIDSMYVDLRYLSKIGVAD